jgi:hypothetical protein
MEDKNSPNKIKREKQIYWHPIQRLIKWSDIKHLTLEDDDTIRSYWDNEDNGFYGEIIRMVEETDEQHQKRIADNERHNKWLKEQRYKSYLKLKQEFEE